MKILVNVALGCVIACAAVPAFAAAGNAAPATQTTSWAADVQKAAGSAAAMKAKIKTLSAADQKKFIKDVNDAIAASPGSNEARAAKFVEINQAALAGVKESGTKNNNEALAEVYATVPVQYLPAVSESLAKGSYGRDVDPSKTYSDKDFSAIAKAAVSAAATRCASADNSSVRVAAICAMFGKASGGTPEGLSTTLADNISNTSDRAIAKDTWLPEAQKGNWNPMMGAAGTDEDSAPNPVVVADLLDGTAATGSLLSGLDTPGTTDATGVFATPDSTILEGDNLMFGLNAKPIEWGAGSAYANTFVGADGKLYHIDSAGNVVEGPGSGMGEGGRRSGGTTKPVTPGGGSEEEPYTPPPVPPYSGTTP